MRVLLYTAQGVRVTLKPVQSSPFFPSSSSFLLCAPSSSP